MTLRILKAAQRPAIPLCILKAAESLALSSSGFLVVQKAPDLVQTTRGCDEEDEGEGQRYGGQDEGQCIPCVEPGR